MKSGVRAVALVAGELVGALVVALAVQSLLMIVGLRRTRRRRAPGLLVPMSSGQFRVAP